MQITLIIAAQIYLYKNTVQYEQTGVIDGWIQRQVDRRTAPHYHTFI